jgi:hypothetical protein
VGPRTTAPPRNTAPQYHRAAVRIARRPRSAPVAQLVAHLVHTEGAAGSRPAGCTHDVRSPGVTASPPALHAGSAGSTPAGATGLRHLGRRSRLLIGGEWDRHPRGSRPGRTCPGIARSRPPHQRPTQKIDSPSRAGAAVSTCGAQRTRRGVEQLGSSPVSYAGGRRFKSAPRYAMVAQLVAHHLAMVGVAGPNPAHRSHDAPRTTRPGYPGRWRSHPEAAGALLEIRWGACLPRGSESRFLLAIPCRSSSAGQSTRLLIGGASVRIRGAARSGRCTTSPRTPR